MSLTNNCRNCPACKSRSFARIEKYDCGTWEIGRCVGCGLVILLNPPEYSRLVDEFAFEKTFAQKSAAKSKLSRLARRVRMYSGLTGNRYGRQFDSWFGAGKVLDVGCGSRNLIGPPAVPFGIEISGDLWEIADRHMRACGGYCLHAPGAEGIRSFDAEFFDGVLMNSYLEHEVGVLEVLHGVFRCLKPDGKVFVRVPNYGSANRRVFGRRWCGFRYPDHVNYFTPRTLRDVISRAGFRMQIVNRATLPIDDNINALLFKN